MSNLVRESEGKYYLEPNTEISKEQYDAINAATQPVSGSLSEAELRRLHGEQDPASPLYKGSQPADAGVSGSATGESEPTSGYFEPTADKVEALAKDIPEPTGTTAFTTEEVTIPAAIDPATMQPNEPVAEEIGANPTTSPEIASSYIQGIDPIEDAGNAGAQ